MSTNYNANIIFCEEQTFPKTWLWIIVIAASLFTIYMIVPHENRLPTGVLITFVIGEAATIFLCWKNGRMVTEVRNDGLQISAKPFIRMKRHIPFDKIQTAEARQYNALMEYGGWGIRYGLRGRAYNISGNQGVQLVLRSGEKLLIGSQKADELAAVIQANLTQTQ